MAYQKLIARSEKILQQSGSLPEKNPPIQKAVMWGAIQLNTLADASPEHVAEMMINGSNMGIVEMSKQVNRYEFADHKSLKLAADFIEGEQRHIEQLKEYLNGKKGYGWHITSPKAFEFYRDIKEFAVYGRCAQECSEYDICMKYDSEETRVECPDFAKVPLKRAPQSWCYVEEI